MNFENLISCSLFRDAPQIIINDMQTKQNGGFYYAKEVLD